MKLRKTFRKLLAVTLTLSLCMGLCSMGASAFEIGPLFDITPSEGGGAVVTPAGDSESEGLPVSSGELEVKTEIENGPEDPVDPPEDPGPVDSVVGDPDPDASTPTEPGGDQEEEKPFTGTEIIRPESQSEEDKNEGNGIANPTAPGSVDPDDPEAKPAPGLYLPWLIPEDTDGNGVSDQVVSSQAVLDTLGEEGIEEVLAGHVTPESFVEDYGSTPANIEHGIMPLALEGVAMIGDTVYESLGAAVTKVQPGETIVLLDDVTLSSEIKVSKPVSIDLGNHTINGNGKITRAFYINSSGNLTIRNGTFEGSGFKTRAIASSGVLTMENVTIQNFDTSGSKLEAFGSALMVSNSGSNIFDTTIRNCTFSNNKTNDAGCVDIKGKVSVIIEDSHFLNNTAKNKGGAVNIDAVASAKISGCEFKDNCLDGSFLSACGGGLNILNSAASITGCTFTGNKIYNAGRPKGGGLCLDCDGIVKGNGAIIELDGNTFTDNWVSTGANSYGGGASLRVASGSGFDIKFGSAEFTGNWAAYGGGLDYSAEGSIPLKLTNVKITGNDAGSYGGGIWVCPASELYMHSTLGGAIYGNTALIRGDDARYNSGLDNPDNVLFSTNSDSIANLAERAPGGYPLNWCKDEMNEGRYNSRNPVPVDESVLTGTKTSFAAHSTLSAEGQSYADSMEGAVVITGNHAMVWGGGIASNSPIIIGEDRDKDLTVKKTWAEGAAPEGAEVTVNLVNKTIDSVVDSVVLSEENDWTYTFTDLPGDQEFTVEEAAFEGYTASYSEVVDGAITITNTPTPTPTPETTSVSVEKVWVVNGEETAAPEGMNVTVNLLRDGSVYRTTVLNAANNWSDTFGGLPIGNDEGHTFVYTVSEVAVDGWTGTVTDNGDGTFTITNAQTPDRGGDDDDDDIIPGDDDDDDIPGDDDDDDIPSDDDDDIPELPPENPPQEDIPEPDVPLTDLPEEQPPLADLPEEPDVPLTDLPEEEVPLSEVPQTGDSSLLWLMAAAASAAGLTWLSLSGRKKEN